LLESRLATFGAQLRATEDEPATPAQIAALARRLSITCTAPMFGQYPCVTRLTGASMPINACSVPATGTNQLLRMRCAAGAVAPITRLGYVDCGTVGPVISVAAPTPTLPPWVNLIEVRVAASAKQFCADFRTAAPPKPGTLLSVLVTRSPSTRSYPYLAPNPAIDFADPGLPGIELFEDPIPGMVGHSGNSISLVLTAQDLRESAAFLGKPFSFRATARYEQRIPGRISPSFSDRAPSGNRPADYP
jgi:hypothetical protein